MNKKAIEAGVTGFAALLGTIVNFTKIFFKVSVRTHLNRGIIHRSPSIMQVLSLRLSRMWMMTPDGRYLGP